MATSVTSVILGIDPGSQVTGWGVIAYKPTAAESFIHLGSGVIEVKTKVSKAKSKKIVGLTGDTNSVNLSDKLHTIYTGIREVIESFAVSEVAVEQVFVATNVNAAMTLGQARGAALAAVGATQLPLASYAATTIKLAVTGYGRASKNQVAKMVNSTLGIHHELPQDSTDALAVALCHAQSGMNSKLSQAILMASDKQ